MNLGKVEFYNVGAFEKIPGVEGSGLVRVPAKIRNQLNERARFIGMESIGVEVQFVTDAPNIDIYISAHPKMEERSSIRVYKGNFLHQTLELKPGHVECHRLTPPIDFDEVNEALLNQNGYSADVWRIVMDRSIVVIHGIDVHGHEIRKPKKGEIPALNWLAYGSSITNSNLDGYPHIAASILGVQVQNKGFSGACHIEKELVDYMLDECSFDFITCELGVNMRGVYTPEEFEERATYLINRLVALGKLALIITTFPNRSSVEYTNNPNSVVSENEKAFNDILVRLVEEAACPTLKLMHGYEVLTDTNGLSADLVHPTRYGHAIMGMNLAKRLATLLNQCKINLCN